MTVNEREIIDRLSRDLDKIEKTTPMIASYARIDPEIVEETQAGITFKFVLYHVESKSWFGRGAIDGAMKKVRQFNLLNPDDVVFDLGCNSGYQTAWMALLVPHGHVHSFDPFPWNTAATRAQAALNGCRNVTTHTVGLGSQDRKITTDISGSKTFNAVAARQGYSMDIQVEKPDYYLKYNPTFLKIDIEGAEYELGSTNLLSHPSVQRGYVEMHTKFIEAGGGDPAFFLNRLLEEKYDVIDYLDRSVSSFPEVAEAAYYFKRERLNEEEKVKANLFSKLTKLFR